jgi:hypothetical protein
MATIVDGQTIEYRAVRDDIGQYVSTRARRRCLVIYFRNGRYQWICGTFSTLPAAEKRAAALNNTNER